MLCGYLSLFCLEDPSLWQKKGREVPRKDVSALALEPIRPEESCSSGIFRGSLEQLSSVLGELARERAS